MNVTINSVLPYRMCEKWCVQYVRENNTRCTNQYTVILSYSTIINHIAYSTVFLEENFAAHNSLFLVSSQINHLLMWRRLNSDLFLLTSPLRSKRINQSQTNYPAWHSLQIMLLFRSHFRCICRKINIKHKVYM